MPDLLRPARVNLGSTVSVGVAFHSGAGQIYKLPTSKLRLVVGSCAHGTELRSYGTTECPNLYIITREHMDPSRNCVSVRGAVLRLVTYFQGFRGASRGCYIQNRPETCTSLCQDESSNARRRGGVHTLMHNSYWRRHIPEMASTPYKGNPSSVIDFRR